MDFDIFLAEMLPIK